MHKWTKFESFSKLVFMWRIFTICFIDFDSLCVKKWPQNQILMTSFLWISVLFTYVKEIAQFLCFSSVITASWRIFWQRQNFKLENSHPFFYPCNSDTFDQTKFPHLRRLLINANIDPLGRPSVTVRNDHYFSTCLSCTVRPTKTKFKRK